jgi:hypothetical protein
MRLMRRRISVLWMLCCMGVSIPTRAQEAGLEMLPPRPTVERPLPGGEICRIGSTDQKCFTLDEWKDMGHLVLDYRALLDWASRAEALYTTQVARTALTEAEAAIQKSATEAALAREGIAQDQAQAARAEADAQRGRAKRLGVLAGVAAGAAVVLAAVVTGLALAR